MRGELWLSGTGGQGLGLERIDPPHLCDPPTLPLLSLNLFSARADGSTIKHAELLLHHFCSDLRVFVLLGGCRVHGHA
jgi:hypothetical protein